MHAIPECRSGMRQDPAAARERFMLRLSGFAQREGAHVTLVFDGGRSGRVPRRMHAGVRVVYSKPPEKADPVIKRMADRPFGRAERIVVTSDREIADFVRHCGVETLSAKAFSKRMAGGSSRPAHPTEMKYDRELSARETDMWMALFQGRSEKSADGGTCDE